MAADLTAIIGAGALGAMYAGQIKDAGLPVAFVAEGERAERLRREQLKLNGRALDIPLVGWDHPPVKHILVAVKHHHLPEVCRHLEGSTLAGPDSVVLSVMNGIDSEEHLQEALDKAGGAIVLPAMAAGMDALRRGNSVTYRALGRIVYGPPPGRPGPAADAAMRAMESLLRQAGIPAVIPEDIIHAIWNKYMLNIGINQWSAVLRARYHVFHQEGPGRTLMRAAMREVLAVARAKGINLTEQDMEGWFSVVESLAAQGKTSMLQDVEARRKTEVEMLAGRMVEMGRALEVPVPVNECLLQAIRVIEESYSSAR